ncbi:MAG: hypothetical protein IJS61_09570 [Firmicutes bacterium]|nr:hypothetical protein [Bacillota bacterium]
MKFKDLTFKQKVEHILHYYSGIFIGFVIFAIAAASLIYTMFIKKPTQNFCGIAIYNSFLSIEDNISLTDKLNKDIGVPEGASVNIQSYYDDKADVTTLANLNQKFNTYLYTGEIGIVITDKKFTADFIAADYYMPLTDYFSREQIKELEKESLLLYGEDDKGNSKPYAVKITDNYIITEYKLFENAETDIYMAIIPQMEPENTLKVFKWLLGRKL